MRDLDQLLRRHAELGAALSGAGIGGAEFAKLSKEYSELSPIVDGIEALRRAEAELAARPRSPKPADDPEMKALAEEELQALRERLPELELQVKLSLLPKDEDDERNAILEVRAGTGGDEAALFAADLFRMYQRYAALRGWRFEVLDLSETGHRRLQGGDRPRSPAATCSPGSNSNRGVHRVQRVPETEASGPHPHLGRDRRGAARGRGGRRRDRRQGSAHRRLPRQRPRRAVGQHDRQRGAHHPSADRARGDPAGREIAAQEQGARR